MILDDNYKEQHWEILQEYKEDSLVPGSNRTIFGLNNIGSNRYGYIDEDGYFITDDLQVNNVLPGPDIEYRINKDGFRSNHFTVIDESRKSIVFSGCSYTFGEALPEEYLWSSILLDKMNLTRGSGNNLGAMGASAKLIVKNVISFVKQYGKPDFVFVVFPDLHRDYIYDKETNRFINCFPHTQWITSKNNKTKKQFTLNYVPENTIASSIDYIRSLEDFCNSRGIKLLWSCWSREASWVYDQLNFENYVRHGDIEFSRTTRNQVKDKSKFHENLNNLPYWEIAKDDGHPGTYWTNYVADLFYEESRKRWGVE